MSISKSDNSPAMLRGTLDLLILKALSTQSLHGVGIAGRIEQMTAGSYSVSFGSLFPALHRMQEKGWLESSWETSDKNRRARFYSLSRLGKKQLEQQQRSWQETVDIMNLALEES